MVRGDIKSRLKQNFKTFDDGSLEASAVQIEINSIWCDICCVYNPGNKVISTEEFDHYFDALGRNSILCGDFNAHNLMWTVSSSIVQSSTGNLLAAALNTHMNFSLLTARGTKTRFDVTTGKYSTIDLAFGSGIFNVVDLIYEGSMMGSDHVPIIYCFNYLPSFIEESFPLSWNLGKMDWSKWKKSLISNMTSSSNSTSQEITKIIVKTIKEFCNLECRKKKIKNHKPFWSEECSYYIALRRKAQKLYEKFPTVANKMALNKQTAITKRFMLRQKRKTWHNFCDSLDHTTPEIKVWRLFKQLQGKIVFDFTYPILHNGTYLDNNLVIANLFADFYSTTFSRVLEIDDIHRKEQEILIGMQFGSSIDYNSDLTMEE